MANANSKESPVTDIEKFKLERLKTPTSKGTERTIASVNRELELLRAMFRFAVRSGSSKALLKVAEHSLVRRMKCNANVYSREEEERLLLACIDRRAHLRAIVIAALDTACRRGELFQMRWSDVDFDNRIISIRALRPQNATRRISAVSGGGYD
ncbi:MAG: site-specific integrase [Blastocatellia bacterium]